MPAYFLIKLWGGPGAARAAYQFVIYTIGGSAFLLLGFAAIFAATGALDFAAARAGWAPMARSAAKLAAVGGCGPRRFSSACSSGLPSRCRSFRSTPGCRRPTPRRRPASRCS